jgi:hypothetical protein
MHRRGLAVLAAVVLAASPTVARSAPPPDAHTPEATCGPGSHPETGIQGQVTAEDHATGYSDSPITCNTEMIGHFGTSGGFKVERHVDAAGHECAYFDSTLLFPLDVPGAIGTYVLDMSDPTNPTETAKLVTPAFLTPHESVLVNQKRGLIAAVMGNPIAHPGIVDIYDIAADCRAPVLKSSTPTGILGHESGFAPDGNTFYASSLSTGDTTAVDVSNPSLPVTLWTGRYASHGLSLNADGTRAYLAARTGTGDGNDPGLIILDVSEIQERVTDPQVSVVGTLSWSDGSIPQNAMPMTIGGHPYLLEIDEFAGTPIPSGQPDAPVGAARIIDIADETKPTVVSNIRLAVHTPATRPKVLDDPGGDFPIGGYTGHYCGIPKEIDPGIVACSMILSGLRIFDIRDPLNPREIAYFNAVGSPDPGDTNVNAFAMSRPSFVPERGEIWYADGNSGFYALRVTNGVWPFTSQGPPQTPGPGPATGGGSLPATGVALPLAAGVGLVVAAMLARRLRARV